jgi:isoamylase
MLEMNSEIFRFVREMIALRARYPVLSRDAFYTESDIAWFGPEGQTPDWDGPNRALGCLIRHAEVSCETATNHSLCLLFNASDSPVEFCLPPDVSRWRIAVDTGHEAPNDIFSASAARPLVKSEPRFALSMCSIAVLSTI